MTIIMIARGLRGGLEHGYQCHIIQFAWYVYTGVGHCRRVHGSFVHEAAWCLATVPYIRKRWDFTGGGFELLFIP